MIMSYDFHELNRTSVNAPLSRENNQNPYTETVAENIDRILAQGCAREKLVMGIPTYGRTYTLMHEDRNGVDEAVDGLGEPGPFTLSHGSLGFNEVRYLTVHIASDCAISVSAINISPDMPRAQPGPVDHQALEEECLEGGFPWKAVDLLR